MHAGFIALACALPFVLLAPFFGAPLMTDEGVFSTIAQELLRGSLPYRDVFDNSPPLGYVWYAIAFILLGKQAWVPHVLLAFSMSATTFLVYLEGRLLFSPRSSLVAAFAFALSAALVLLGPRAQKEYLLLPLLVAALVSFTRGVDSRRLGWFLAAGVASGLGILTSQLSAIHFLVLLAFAAWLELRDAPRLGFRVFHHSALLIGGVIGVFLLVALPYILSGAARDLVYGLVEYPLLYADSGIQSRWALAVGGLAWFFPVAAPWFFTSVVGGVALLRRRPDEQGWLLLAWTIASVIAILAPGHFRRYYFILLLPGMALLTGFSLLALPYFLRQGVRRAALYVGLFSTVFVSAYLNGFVYLQPSSVERLIASGGVDYRLREAQSPALAAYVAEQTTPADRIFNLGRQAELYFYAMRRPASRYMDTYPLDYDPRTLQTLLADLETNRPIYIVDTQWPMYLQGIDSPYPPEVRQFLQRHYAHERTFEFDPWLAAIYERLTPRDNDRTTLGYFADVWRLSSIP